MQLGLKESKFIFYRRFHCRRCRLYLKSLLFIREFKFHVYNKRQTSDSSWECLKIDYEQMKKAQKSSYG